MNETNQAPATGGTKLSTIFMVVLGLHIVVIVVISAFYFMKPRSHPEMAETTAPAITEGAPVISSDSTAAPGTDTTAAPVVETNTAPQISEEMINTMASSGPDSPMPASSDAVWANTPAEAPDQADTQPNLAANLQTPPARLEPKPFEPKTVAQAPVAPVKKAPVASTSTSKAKTYSVVAGDNLTKVAKKNSTTVAQLKKTNGLTSDSLKIGQVLKVPGAAAATTAVASTTAVAPAPAKKSTTVAASEPAPANGSTYQVVKGDTLWKIAKSFGVSTNALAQTNGLNDPKDLKVGATLKIPRSAAKAAAKPAPVREAQASAPVTKFRDPVVTMDMARL